MSGHEIVIIHGQELWMQGGGAKAEGGGAKAEGGGAKAEGGGVKAEERSRMWCRGHEIVTISGQE